MRGCMLVTGISPLVRCAHIRIMTEALFRFFMTARSLPRRPRPSSSSLRVAFIRTARPRIRSPSRTCHKSFRCPCSDGLIYLLVRIIGYHSACLVLLSTQGFRKTNCTDYQRLCDGHQRRRNRYNLCDKSFVFITHRLRDYPRTIAGTGKFITSVDRQFE